MTTLLIILCQNVEEKRLNVIIERLVVQKKLCKQTKVLAKNFADISINLKQRGKEMGNH